MEAQNQSMNSGHCEGMAVLAAHIDEHGVLYVLGAAGLAVSDAGGLTVHGRATVRLRC